MRHESDASERPLTASWVAPPWPCPATGEGRRRAVPDRSRSPVRRSAGGLPARRYCASTPARTGRLAHPLIEWGSGGGVAQHAVNPLHVRPFVALVDRHTRL